MRIYIKKLFYISLFFTLSFVSTSFASSSCLNRFSNDLKKSGSDIFIQFLKIDSKNDVSPSSELREEIVRYSKEWNAEDAINFLRYLGEKIGKDKVSRMLSDNSSVLERVDYTNLVEKIKLYEYYIGKDVLLRHLNSDYYSLSLNGFGKEPSAENLQLFFEMMKYENVRGLLFHSIYYTESENFKKVVSEMTSPVIDKRP